MYQDRTVAFAAATVFLFAGHKWLGFTSPDGAGDTEGTLARLGDNKISRGMFMPTKTYVPSTTGSWDGSMPAGMETRTNNKAPEVPLYSGSFAQFDDAQYAEFANDLKHMFMYNSPASHRRSARLMQTASAERGTFGWRDVAATLAGLAMVCAIIAVLATVGAVVAVGTKVTGVAKADLESASNAARIAKLDSSPRRPSTPPAPRRLRPLPAPRRLPSFELSDAMDQQATADEDRNDFDHDFRKYLSMYR